MVARLLVHALDEGLRAAWRSLPYVLRVRTWLLERADVRLPH
jgi:hypothetical protein